MIKNKLIIKIGAIALAGSMLSSCAYITATDEKVKSITANKLRVDPNKVEITNKEMVAFGIFGAEWNANTPKGEYFCSMNNTLFGYTITSCAKAELYYN